MYVFLDIDGVLNKERDWKSLYTLNDENINAFIDCLCKLKKYYSDINIVLTSSWRTYFKEDKNILSKLTDNLLKIGLRINDCTPITNKTRQEEIEYYIKRNNVDNYVIIDDDLSLFPNPNNLIIYTTDYKIGLVKDDIKRIIKLIK